MAGFGRLARSSLAPILCLALYSPVAAAQDKAAAESLFDSGVRLMKQNNFAEACPRLEESNRLDPAVGTLLYLGECYERGGKTASAWATFREAASLATNSNQADRARVASGRAQELEPKLSRLSVELSPDVAKIPGVLVKRGNQRVDPSLYGTPLPVDPGDYRVEVSAPGYEVWSTPISVAAGGNANVRVPGLIKAPDVPAEPTTTAAPSDAGAPVGPADSTPPPPPARGMSTQQVLGLFVGGVGLVGVGLGSYFGIRAISMNSDAEEHCPNAGLCNDQTGLDLTDDAKREARFSNIAFVAGGVLVATGAVLFLTGTSKQGDSVALVPLVAPNLAAASIMGRF